MRSLVRISILLTTAASLFATGSVEAQGGSARLQVGDLAPPVTVAGWWKNRAPRFEKGTVCLIDFWASWCGPCRQSFPHLAEVQSRYAGQNVVTVAVSIDDSTDAAAKFLQSQGGQFETYIGVDAQKRTWANWAAAAGRTGIPCAFLVGRDGKIAWIGHPMSADEPLRQLVQTQATQTPFLSTSSNRRSTADQRPSSIAQKAPDSTSVNTRIAQIRARWAQLRPAYQGTPYQQQPVLAPNFQTGLLQDDFVRDGLKTLNFARFLAGLPDDVTIDDSLQTQAQCGALLLAHLKRLDHTPRQPDDFPAALYKIAYRSTSSSNLAQGPNTLDGAIRLYMDDSPRGPLQDNQGISLGHRRWILNPALQKTGMGFVNGFSTMQSFDHSRDEDVQNTFVAWPANGAHPTEFFAPHTIWSLTLNPAIYRVSQGGQVQITLRRARDGKTWNFPGAGGYFSFNTEGFGVNNCLMFRPKDVENYRDGDQFEVAVAGLMDANGQNAELRYAVTFFDLGNSTVAVQPAAQELPNTTQINQAVLTFAEANLNTQVGNGECWTLADEALAIAQGKRPNRDGYGAFVFGRELDLQEQILPGDIVQFTAAKITFKRGGWAATAPHHTGIVCRVAGTSIEILHQNWNQNRRVGHFQFDLTELTQGQVQFFRPEPA